MLAMTMLAMLAMTYLKKNNFYINNGPTIVSLEQ